YFDVMAGALMDETRTSKDEVITYAAAKLGLDNVAHAVMIGDREHDVLGAQKNGMDSIGVLWGFGDRHELTAAHATHIVSTVNELTSLLLESP
ncbi:MAG: HAD family hydrolase, partial [Ruminococcaceae bacterium]|nr:HAD family hydrolase [Oscillospiraceae bacterium]